MELKSRNGSPWQMRDIDDYSAYENNLDDSVDDNENEDFIKRSAVDDQDQINVLKRRLRFIKRRLRFAKRTAHTSSTYPSFSRVAKAPRLRFVKRGVHDENDDQEKSLQEFESEDKASSPEKGAQKYEHEHSRKRRSVSDAIANIVGSSEKEVTLAKRPLFSINNSIRTLTDMVIRAWLERQEKVREAMRRAGKRSVADLDLGNARFNLEARTEPDADRRPLVSVNSDMKSLAKMLSG